MMAIGCPAAAHATLWKDRPDSTPCTATSAPIPCRAADEYDLMFGGNGADSHVRWRFRRPTTPATFWGPICMLGRHCDCRLGYSGNGDSMFGGYGDDWMSGGIGDDLMRGNAGDDEMYGNEDDDLMTGNRGDDFMSGGEGADDMSGGSGNDDHGRQ